MIERTPEDWSKRGQGTPPYVGFNTFRNFLDKISKSVPTQIDHSVMPRTSKAIRSQLAAALRYLGLIGGDGSRTEVLLKLARAQDAERKHALGEVVRAAYPYLFANFDLLNCTTSQLGQEFRRRGASGDTVRKCVGFFVGACREAGIDTSPHVKPFWRPDAEGQGIANPPEAVRGRIEEKNPRRREWDDGISSEGYPRDWRASLLLKFPGFDPAWSEGTKSKWFDDFGKLIDCLTGNQRISNDPHVSVGSAAKRLRNRIKSQLRKTKENPAD